MPVVDSLDAFAAVAGAAQGLHVINVREAALAAGHNVIDRGRGIRSAGQAQRTVPVQDGSPLFYGQTARRSVSGCYALADLLVTFGIAGLPGFIGRFAVFSVGVVPDLLPGGVSFFIRFPPGSIGGRLAFLVRRVPSATARTRTGFTLPARIGIGRAMPVTTLESTHHIPTIIPGGAMIAQLEEAA